MTLLADEIVACVPGVELVRNLSVEPLVEKVPAVVVVLAGSCSVPLLKMRLFDMVVGPENAKVPPPTDLVIEYKVLPADVIVAVPAVLEKE